MFFHPENERGPTRSVRERKTKQIYARCPVLEQCRQHALTVHEPYGIWGGLTENERFSLLSGRPLAADAG